jgi:hypothetical protein
MTCPGCQQDNPTHARFCLGCGARLVLACAACGAGLPGGARFCLQCGQTVPGGTAGPVRALTPETYTPQHLAEENPHVEGCPGRRAQAGHGAVRRSQGFDGIAGRP